MAENVNPSVVEGDGPSNYNLSRSGGMQQTDVDYIENLQKTLKSSPVGALPTNQYYPTAGRSINVGQIGSKTLGSVPIFTAGSGLIPIGMIEAKREALHKAKLAEFAMFGPGNNEVYDQFIELANPYAQPAFNEKIQATVNEHLDKNALLFGGDYGKSRLYTNKYDPEFKAAMANLKNYARGYQAVFASAMKVFQDASSRDRHVDEEVLGKAVDVIQNHDNMANLSLEELANNVTEFQSQVSVVKAVELAIADVGTRVRTTIAEDPKLSTDAIGVFKKIKETGIYTEEEINSMIETEKELYPHIKNDPEMSKLFERLFRNGIDQEIEESITTFQKDYADTTRNWNTGFGIYGNQDVGYQGTPTTMVTPDGKSEYNTQYVTIPPKNIYNRDTNIQVNSSDFMWLKDEKGVTRYGHFNTPSNFTPSKLYKTPWGSLQVVGSADIWRMQHMEDPAGQRKPIAKGEKAFNVVSGPNGAEVIDIVDMEGTYEIIMDEKDVAGQLHGQFEQGSWRHATVVANSLSTPKIKHRIRGAVEKFITLKEGKDLAETKRGGKAREWIEDQVEETGEQYNILEDNEYLLPDGKWYNLEEITAVEMEKGSTEEEVVELLKEHLYLGNLKYRSKSK